MTEAIPGMTETIGPASPNKQVMISGRYQPSKDGWYFLFSEGD
jgi:hypothetical protein